MKTNSTQSEGISLRTIHLWLIIGAAIISCLMFYSTYNLSTSFRHLTETSEQQIELRKAARELMDASDYLTEKVQRFAVLGDMRFLEEYFKEAFEANHREEAITRMEAGSGADTALEKLKAAMESSVSLMNREYYAMRLVIDAQGYTDYPDLLHSVVLSDEDMALTREEKMLRAAVMVHDDEYYAQKEHIRINMKASLDELEQMAYDTDASALESLRGEMRFVRFVIILQILVMIFMVWLTSRLGIHPVLNAVERIKADSPIPEVGANEFRYLARAYNKMYDVYRKSLEHLNFKASHDELTGAYNRAGYDLLLSSIDLSSTYMLLFDVDNFKGINDTYGHETGDKVLVKLVQILKNNFRSDDYICRIGGDEFVVFMVHISGDPGKLIEDKVIRINQELSNVADGLPPITLSAGVSFDPENTDPAEMFRQADIALYYVKDNGRNDCCFYSDALKGKSKPE